MSVCVHAMGDDEMLCGGPKGGAAQNSLTCALKWRCSHWAWHSYYCTHVHTHSHSHTLTVVFFFIFPLYFSSSYVLAASAYVRCSTNIYSVRKVEVVRNTSNACHTHSNAPRHVRQLIFLYPRILKTRRPEQTVDSASNALDFHRLWFVTAIDVACRCWAGFSIAMQFEQLRNATRQSKSSHH